MNAGIDNEPASVTFAFQRNSSETAPLYGWRRHRVPTTLVPTTIIIDICTAISKSLSFLATRREGSRFLARWAAVNRVVVFDDRWCDANPDLYHIGTDSAQCALTGFVRMCIRQSRIWTRRWYLAWVGRAESDPQQSRTYNRDSFEWREWTKCSSLT